MITQPRVEGVVRTPDGRKLGFAEFGPAEGRALVWFHGTPGARRQVPQAARALAKELDLRILGIDRPGVGLSTPHLHDSILGFAYDVRHVADELGIGELVTVGLSGGGPYALAAAAAMPERVKAVGVLGGVAPTQGEDAATGGPVGLLKRFGPIVYLLREPMATLFTGFVRAVRPVASPAFDLYARTAPEGDRKVFARPEVKSMFLDDLVGNSRRGLRAPIYDAVLFSRHWGFSYADVRAPVRWWHGDADNFVPLAHARAAVQRLPEAELYLRPGESHLGGLGAAEDVLTELLEAAGW